MSERSNNSDDVGPRASRARTGDPALAAAQATMEKVLFAEMSADVHFIIGDPQKGDVERIPAIVAILCAASDVFKAMFVGEFEKPTEVPVPDAEPEAFKVMLRYIYTGAIQLNKNSSIGILYLAKKYMLQPLVDRTARYIMEHMTPDDVCFYLDCTDIFDEVKEKTPFWMLGPHRLQNDGGDRIDGLSASVSTAALRRLRADTLCIEEIYLYERAIEWAEAQLEANHRYPTPSAMRDLLGDALFAIRFSVMELEVFSTFVAKYGVLTDEEVAEVFLCHSIQYRPTSFICDSRAHGRLYMNLDLRALIDGSLASPHVSAPRKIGDGTWSICAYYRLAMGGMQNMDGLLGVFLKCHGLSDNPEWRQDAYAVMRIVAQVDGIDDIRQITGCTYKPSADYWGFPEFAYCDHLLDENNGFLIDDTYVEVIVEVFTKDCAPPTVAATCTATHFD